MDKNTKILLGVAGLALVGYYLFQSSSKETNSSKVTFVNANGKSGQPCSFRIDGEVVNGKVSELDTNYCFSSDGRRGLIA